MGLSNVLNEQDFVGLLTHTCTIRRPSVIGTDSGGLPMYSYDVDVTTDVKCRPEPLSTVRLSKRVDVSPEIAQANFVLFLESTTDVDGGCRITDIQDENGNAIDGVFDVIGLPQDASAAGHHREVYIRGLRDGH